jgi:phosphatidylethanolamine/phosphatidyl-N-methylethanolamine N-methyltransferase
VNTALSFILVFRKTTEVSKQTANFYNRFSFFYPLVDVFLSPQKKKLFREINSCPQGSLLEIGVGNGRHLSLYKTHHITGIDTSSRMLKMAGKKYNGTVTLLQMDGQDLRFPDHHFDYVVLSHVIAVVDDPEKLLEEAYRVLKPNGKIFILNHFTPSNWLYYADKTFNKVSGIFHFKSLFYIERFVAIKKFKLLKEIRLDRLSYFKLLIFCKA